MDEDGSCMVLPRDPCCCADYDDLSCLTHGLSCLDQPDPCFAHVLACFDQSSNPHDPCLNPHDSLPDKHDEPSSDPHQLIQGDVPCLDDCEQFYLHLNPHADELEDVVGNSSIIMNELFDSNDYFEIGLGDGEEEEEEEDGEEKRSSSSSSSSSDGVGNGVLRTASAEKCVSGDGRSRARVETELGEDVREEEALLLAEVERAERLGLERMPAEAVEEMKGRSSDSEQSSRRRKRKRKGRKKKKIMMKLGVEKAIPSKILEIMDIDSLTRHNVASHLQKYRSHKKQMPTRSDEIAATLVAKDLSTNRPLVLSAGAKAMRPAKRGGGGKATERLHRPMLPLPELHVWGHPTIAMEHFWPPCWPSAPLGCTWGNPFLYTPPQPILRIPLAPMLIMPVVPPLKHEPLAKEMVAASINEVLRNPLVPLPLGLKPPPLESVISELQCRGVSIAS